MAWNAKRTRVAGEIILDGLSRLVDIAPTEIVVLSEDSDMIAMGEDFTSAIEVLAPESDSVQADTEELVEA